MHKSREEEEEEHKSHYYSSSDVRFKQVPISLNCISLIYTSLMLPFTLDSVTKSNTQEIISFFCVTLRIKIPFLITYNVYIRGQDLILSWGEREREREPIFSFAFNEL